MKDKELLKVLKLSLGKLYKKDCYLLNQEHFVHEQTIAHRVAYYFERYIEIKNKDFYKEYNFDVEYNKNLKQAKVIFKQCNNCQYKSDCNNPTKNDLVLVENISHTQETNINSDKEPNSRPDFVIHQRGNNENNILIVEFKKTNSKNEYIDDDIDKLQYYTCSHSEYKYQLGCFVFIGTNGYIITTFKKGKAIRSSKYTRETKKRKQIESPTNSQEYKKLLKESINQQNFKSKIQH